MSIYESEMKEVEWTRSTKPERGSYVDYFRWLEEASALGIARTRWFGRYASWWKSEAETSPNNWTLPPHERDNDDMLLHLRNSKDGTTVDQLYMGLKTEASTNWHSRWNVTIPPLSDLPSGTTISFGYEVPSEGGYTLANLKIHSGSAGLHIQLGKADGSYYTDSLDVSDVIAENGAEYRLIWLPPELMLHCVNTGKTRILVGSKPIHSIPKTVPFMSNESSVVSSGVKVKKWVSYNMSRARTGILYRSGDSPPYSTPLAGLSVDPDVTSEPFPLFNYSRKTILFQADGAGTLDIDILTQTGNWRTYDSQSVSANTLLTYNFGGEAYTGKVKFTPDNPPATINDAEVVLG